MPRLGYKPTEEHKKNISLVKLGKPIKKSPKSKPMALEHKKKIGLANLGHRHSEETRKKMSLTRKGKAGIWMKGRKLSEETKRKMSLARTRNPNQVFTNSSIELKIQKLLQEAKIEFEVNYPILGRPDIFIKPNICIFADGCYWHRCPECGFQESIKKEREKDKRITTELQKQGYIVFRFWEHEINQLPVR